MLEELDKLNLFLFLRRYNITFLINLELKWGK